MSKPVTIYSTQTCGYCKSAKEFMAENNISYDEIDVGNDQEKAREMIEKSGQMGVPVIIVGEAADEEIIIGFDKDRLSAAVGL